MASRNFHKIKHNTNKSLSETEAAWRRLTWCVSLWVSVVGCHVVRGRPQGRACYTALRFPFAPCSSQKARVRCWERQRSSPRWPACSHPLHFGCCPCGHSCSPGLCDGASPPVASSSPVAAAPVSVCWWPEREGRQVRCAHGGGLRCRLPKGDTGRADPRGTDCFSAGTEKTHLTDQSDVFRITAQVYI